MHHHPAPASSTRVQITLHGRIATVDSDQVKLLKKKEAAVKMVLSLNDDLSYAAKLEMDRNTAIIIRTNRRLRRTVVYGEVCDV